MDALSRTVAQFALERNKETTNDLKFLETKTRTVRTGNVPLNRTEMVRLRHKDHALYKTPADQMRSVAPECSQQAFKMISSNGLVATRDDIIKFCKVRDIFMTEETIDNLITDAAREDGPEIGVTQVDLEKEVSGKFRFRKHVNDWIFIVQTACGKENIFLHVESPARQEKILAGYETMDFSFKPNLNLETARGTAAGVMKNAQKETQKKTSELIHNYKSGVRNSKRSVRGEFSERAQTTLTGGAAKPGGRIQIVPRAKKMTEEDVKKIMAEKMPSTTSTATGGGIALPPANYEGEAPLEPEDGGGEGGEGSPPGGPRSLTPKTLMSRNDLRKSVEQFLAPDEEEDGEMGRSESQRFSFADQKSFNEGIQKGFERQARVVEKIEDGREDAPAGSPGMGADEREVSLAVMNTQSHARSAVLMTGASSQTELGQTGGSRGALRSPSPSRGRLAQIKGGGGSRLSTTSLIRSPSPTQGGGRQSMLGRSATGRGSPGGAGEGTETDLRPGSVLEEAYAQGTTAYRGREGMILASNETKKQLAKLTRLNKDQDTRAWTQRPRVKNFDRSHTRKTHIDLMQEDAKVKVAMHKWAPPALHEMRAPFDYAAEGKPRFDNSSTVKRKNEIPLHTLFASGTYRPKQYTTPVKHEKKLTTVVSKAKRDETISGKPYQELRLQPDPPPLPQGHASYLERLGFALNPTEFPPQFITHSRRLRPTEKNLSLGDEVPYMTSNIEET